MVSKSDFYLKSAPLPLKKILDPPPGCLHELYINENLEKTKEQKKVMFQNKNDYSNLDSYSSDMIYILSMQLVLFSMRTELSDCRKQIILFMT